MIASAVPPVQRLRPGRCRLLAPRGLAWRSRSRRLRQNSGGVGQIGGRPEPAPVALSVALRDGVSKIDRLSVRVGRSECEPFGYEDRAKIKRAASDGRRADRIGDRGSSCPGDRRASRMGVAYDRGGICQRSFSSIFLGARPIRKCRAADAALNSIEPIGLLPNSPSVSGQEFDPRLREIEDRKGRRRRALRLSLAGPKRPDGKAEKNGCPIESSHPSADGSVIGALLGSGEIIKPGSVPLPGQEVAPVDAPPPIVQFCLAAC